MAFHGRTHRIFQCSQLDIGWRAELFVYLILSAYFARSTMVISISRLP